MSTETNPRVYNGVLQALASGLTVRDVFAIQAMNALLTNWPGVEHDELCSKSYDIADSMLAARDVTPIDLLNAALLEDARTRPTDAPQARDSFDAEQLAVAAFERIDSCGFSATDSGTLDVVCLPLRSVGAALNDADELTPPTDVPVRFHDTMRPPAPTNGEA